MHLTQGSDSLHFYYDAQNRPAIVDYNGTLYRYIYNLQGDVLGLLDGNNTEVVQYTYDAWGKILSVTGTLASTVGTVQPFRYRGYVYDIETGLYYLRSRYYNPEIGRFLNADALIEGNIYNYCYNNWINNCDFNGMEAVDSSYDPWGYSPEEYGLSQEVIDAIRILLESSEKYAYSRKVNGSYQFGVHTYKDEKYGVIHICCAYVLRGLYGGHTNVEGKYRYDSINKQKLKSLDQLKPGMFLFQINGSKFEHIGLVLFFDFGDGLELAVFQSTSVPNLGDKGYTAYFLNDENAGPNIVALRDIGNWTHFGTPKQGLKPRFFFNKKNEWYLFK